MAPFGGVKNSGCGKFGGDAGIASFTELRCVIVQQHGHTIPSESANLGDNMSDYTGRTVVPHDPAPSTAICMPDHRPVDHVRLALHDRPGSCPVTSPGPRASGTMNGQ